MPRYKHRIILTGGGTGGHVHPALAVGEELLRIDPQIEIIYAGTGSPEREMIPVSMKFVEFKSIGMPNVLSFKFIRFVATIGLGTLQALYFFLKFRPTAIFATGGFVSAPSVFAAIVLSKLKLFGRNIPIHLFEPNAEPGRMNKLIQKYASRVSVTTEFAKKVFQSDKVFIDGYPIRWVLEEIDTKSAKEKLNIPKESLLILAFGGSMGARALNDALIRSWKSIKEYKNLYLIIAVGRKETAEFHPWNEAQILMKELDFEKEERLIIVKSFDDMSIPYSAADIVIARAGAGTIAEFSYYGKPTILVPKANLPLDHQAVNAFTMGLKKIALVVYERIRYNSDKTELFVNPTDLIKKISLLVEDEVYRKNLSALIIQEQCINVRRKLAEIVIQFSSKMKIEETDLLDTPKHSIFIENLPVGLSSLGLRKRFESDLAKNSIQWNWFGLAPDKVLQKELISVPDSNRIRQIPNYEYYCYRSETMLGNPSWEVQNEGIKLSALCCNDEVLPVLMNWIRDRKSTTKFKKCFGGDFKTVGFLRRNATYALPAFQRWDVDFTDTIIHSMSDPYWEVRTAAMRVICRYPYDLREKNYERIFQSLERTMEIEKHFEVLTVAWLAYGYLLSDVPNKKLLERDLINQNDLVRTAIFYTIERLLKRGNKMEASLIEYIQNRVLMTTSQFTPRFDLRQAISNFQKAVSENRCSIG